MNSEIKNYDVQERPGWKTSIELQAESFLSDVVMPVFISRSHPKITIQTIQELLVAFNKKMNNLGWDEITSEDVKQYAWRQIPITKKFDPFFLNLVWNILDENKNTTKIFLSASRIL